MKRILVFAILLLVPVATSEAANIWLSTSTTSSAVGEVPNLGFLGPGETGQLGVWVQNDPGMVMENVSLNIVTVAPVTPGFNNKIAFTGVSVKNPLQDLGGGTVFGRFEFTKDSDSTKEIPDPNDPNGTITVPDPIAVSPDQINGFQGFTVNKTDIIGVGIKTPILTDADPFYDAVNDTFLLAVVDFETSGGAGDTDIYLQIGENGVNNKGGSSSDITIVFGPDDGGSHGLNGNDDRGVNSAFPSANITVETPEPSSILLLVLGVIGLLGLRRRSA